MPPTPAITEARQCVPGDYVFMQTGLAVASGWALTASGFLTDTISIARAAGADAHKRYEPTHELACVQLAAQWGDRSGAPRARELANELSLPLADAVARHTESLLADDGEGLLAAIGRLPGARRSGHRRRRRRPGQRGV
jgi:hypothetical protein